MLGIIKSKFRSKKAIHACLFLGITLLIAVFCSYPMFETGADNSILYNAFNDYAKENNHYPGAVLQKETINRDTIKSIDDVLDMMKANEKVWEDKIDLPVIDYERVISTELKGGSSAYKLYGAAVTFVYIDNVSDHIVMLEGQSLEEAKVKTGKDGKKYYPVFINTNSQEYYKVVKDEEFTFTSKSKYETYEIGFYVAGVFEKKSVDDLFWENDYANSAIRMLLSKETFNDMFFENNVASLAYEDLGLFDVRYLTREKVNKISKNINKIAESTPKFSDNIRAVLSPYRKDAATISMLLNVLVFPTLVLLVFFIIMISSQIIKGEESEIAVLRSRGRTRFFVFRSYLVEALVSVAICYLPGIALGYVLGKVMAHCDSFLHFVSADTSYYMFDFRMFLFALVACALAVVCYTVPAIKESKLTIVKQKAQNPYANKKSFWEKTFLDLILLAVSIYLLKTNLDKKEAIAESVILGKALDPVVFVSYSVFMLACALVFMRLVKYIIAIIDIIGKNKWKPAVYASFLQIRRTFRSQSLIAVFVIMTIGSGVFYASLAGTISMNTKRRTVYENGSDAVVKSYWNLRGKRIKGTTDIVYFFEEPELDVYEKMRDEGIIESYTGVVRDDRARIVNKHGMDYPATYLAINTKTFGETASLIEGRSNVEWYEALNALSEKIDGAIICKDFADKHDIKIGDYVSLVKDISKNTSKKVVETMNTAVEVVAIVDAFPSYEKYTYKVSNVQEFQRENNNLIVINYAYGVQNGGMLPYEVWMKYGKNGSKEAVQKMCKDNNVVLVEESYIDELNDQIKTNIKNVITYGMFTMSFIIALIASGIGLMLFWGMSVNDRSLVFGVFRAMGLKKKELNIMLLMEQIFTTGMAIVGGAVIGIVTAVLFVKLVAVVYLPKTSVIPMVVTFDPINVITIILVVTAFMIVCWYIMRYMIRKLKIVDAIKIGED